jgi:hypothetical protein
MSTLPAVVKKSIALIDADMTYRLTWGATWDIIRKKP